MAEDLLRGVFGIGVVEQVPAAETQHERLIPPNQAIEGRAIAVPSVSIEQFEVLHGRPGRCLITEAPGFVDRAMRYTPPRPLRPP
jgi:hypothetical protein